MNLNLIQDEPYDAVVSLLDDDGVTPLPLPAGAPRMHVRSNTRYSTLLLVDATQYLRIEGEAVVIDLPASVTVTLPPKSAYDLWVGDSRLVRGEVLTDPSVTVRTYP